MRFWGGEGLEEHKITVFQTKTKLHPQDAAILPFGTTVTVGLLRTRG